MKRHTYTAYCSCRYWLQLSQRGDQFDYILHKNTDEISIVQPIYPAHLSLSRKTCEPPFPGSCYPQLLSLIRSVLSPRFRMSSFWYKLLLILILRYLSHDCYRLFHDYPVTGLRINSKIYLSVWKLKHVSILFGESSNSTVKTNLRFKRLFKIMIEKISGKVYPKTVIVQCRITKKRWKNECKIKRW